MPMKVHAGALTPVAPGRYQEKRKHDEPSLAQRFFRAFMRRVGGSPKTPSTPERPTETFVEAYSRTDSSVDSSDGTRTPSTPGRASVAALGALVKNSPSFFKREHFRDAAGTLAEGTVSVGAGVVGASADPHEHANIVWLAELKKREKQMDRSKKPLRGLLRNDPSSYRLDVQRMRINAFAQRTIADQFRAHLFRRRMDAFVALLRLVDNAPERGVAEKVIVRALEVGATAKQLVCVCLGLKSSADPAEASDAITPDQICVLDQVMKNGASANMDMRRRLGQRILASYMAFNAQNKRNEDSMRYERRAVAIRTAQSCAKWIDRTRANVQASKAKVMRPQQYFGVIDANVLEASEIRASTSQPPSSNAHRTTRPLRTTFPQPTLPGTLV